MPIRLASHPSLQMKNSSHPKWRILLILPCLFFALSGCGGGGSSGSSPEISDVQNGIVRYSVGMIAQNDNYSCATTSTAMAISYFAEPNPPINKDTAFAISGSNINTIQTAGNDMAGLKNIANHYGYKSEYLNNMSIEMLENLLAAKALIVLNIKAGDTGSATHAVLATGYNKNLRKIYINDPAQRISEFDYTYLESRWSAALSNPASMSIRSGFIIYPEKL